MKLKILITILVVGNINTFGASNDANAESVRKLKILRIKKLAFLNRITELHHFQLKKLMQKEEEFSREILSNEEDADRTILQLAEEVKPLDIGTKSQPSISASASESSAAPAASSNSALADCYILYIQQISCRDEQQKEERRRQELETMRQQANAAAWQRELRQREALEKQRQLYDDYVLQQQRDQSLSRQQVLSRLSLKEILGIF